MNRKSSTILIGSAVLAVIMLLVIYMGLIVTGIVDTRPDELLIVANSAEKEYDGKPLTCHEYTIKRGKLKKGHEIVAEYDAEQLNAGSCENTIKVKIVDGIGADVTNHYRLETRSGSLTVVPRKLVLRSADAEKVYDGAPLRSEAWEASVGKIPEELRVTPSFTGEQFSPGTSKNAFTVSIRDQNGESVDRNFSISYIYGTLRVTKRSLVITSYGASKIYDGQPLVHESYTYDGELSPYDALYVTFPSKITNVGSVTNNVEVRVLSGSQDVTSFYDIEVRVGSLEVKPRPIEVSASPCIRHFSGSTLPQGQWYITKGTLVDAHAVFASVEAILNDQGTVEFLLRDVGVFNPNDMGAGHNVSDQYEITLVHGVDRDQLEKLKIASGSKSGPFTGEPLTCEQYTLMSGVLEEGHVIQPHFTGSQTEIGFSDNTFSVVITDQLTGEEVTYRYDIEYQFGTLEIYENAPSTGGEIGDDGSLDNNVQNEDATAAKLWADQGGRVYLRWKSYGAYTFREDLGNWGWGEAIAYPGATVNMLHMTGKALAADGKAPTVYTIEILGNQFLVPNYTAQGFEGAVNDVILAPYSTAYTLSAYSWNYSYADALRYAAEGVENEQNRAYTEFVYGQYLSVPESTKQALLELAAQNGLVPDRLSIIEDVASYIRSAAEYDKEYPACPAGEDEVIYFLTDSKSGVCRHFASAATLMYRSLGIPARYVVGYSTYATANTWNEVKGADAHAWVEVFITGLGWVRIDPTPASSGEVSDDALVLALSKVLGYYTGLPYAATEDNVMILQGELQEGHVLDYVEVSGSRTDAGTAVSTIGNVVIRDQNGVDVTAEYKIVRQDGVIEVRKPTLTVTAASAKKMYDGTALSAPTYTHSFTNAALSSLYTVTATISGTQTEVGQSVNGIGPVKVVDPLGRDITSNFEIRRIEGTLKVYLYELTLSTQGSSKTYDATPLDVQGVDYDSSALASRGHELRYSLPKLTNVGSIYNAPTYQIVDADQNDVTDQYDVHVNAGVLRVKPIMLTLQTESAQKVYDGRALRVNSFMLVSGTLANGQSIKDYRITGSQTNVGESEAYVVGIVIVDAQGRDATANYQITILPGTLTVLAP